MKPVEAIEKPWLPWTVVSPNLKNHTGGDDQIVRLLRPYSDSGSVVPGWAYGLACALWYDTDATKGLGPDSIERALAWASRQSSPTEAARALLFMHTQGVRSGALAVLAFLEDVVPKESTDG